EKQVEFGVGDDLSALTNAELNARIAELTANLAFRLYDPSDLACRLGMDELEILETIRRKIASAGKETHRSNGQMSAKRIHSVACGLRAFCAYRNLSQHSPETLEGYLFSTRDYRGAHKRWDSRVNECNRDVSTVTHSLKSRRGRTR